MRNKFSIFNFQFSIEEGGFTLIELLVTMGVIVVIGAILVNIIVSTLRVSSKATVLSDVKQNGDTALSQVVRTLRSADSITINPACSSTPQSTQHITVTQVNNTQTAFDCSGNTLTANGASLLDTNSVKLTGCSIICTQQTPTDYPIIQIQFTLQQNNASASVDKTATVPFQTSVVLRNVQP